MKLFHWKRHGYTISNETLIVFFKFSKKASQLFFPFDCHLSKAILLPPFFSRKLSKVYNPPIFVWMFLISLFSSQKKSATSSPAPASAYRQAMTRWEEARKKGSKKRFMNNESKLLSFHKSGAGASRRGWYFSFVSFFDFFSKQKLN